jgi:hypothetical protein
VPNGRSGGFAIKRKKLKNLLKEFDGSTVIGSNFPTRTPVTADAAIKILKYTWTWRPIGIEEQDSKYYILHLSEWFSVDASSPLYAALREYHINWLKEMVQKRRK